MKYLLDTCILSELIKPTGNVAVRDTIAKIDGAQLFISVVTVGEIAKGIFLLPHTRKRKLLSDWLLGVETSFASRLLPYDKDTAIAWGEMTARAKQQGRTLPALDGIIAATAIQHGLHVMTRNVKDFEHSGVPVVNPWERTEH